MTAISSVSSALPLIRRRYRAYLESKSTSCRNSQCWTNTLPLIKNGKAPRRPQNHAEATYVGRRTAEDGAIDWNAPGHHDQQSGPRGDTTLPGAFTYRGQRKMTIWESWRICTNTLRPTRNHYLNCIHWSSPAVKAHLQIVFAEVEGSVLLWPVTSWLSELNLVKGMRLAPKPVQGSPAQDTRTDSWRQRIYRQRVN